VAAAGVSAAGWGARVCRKAETGTAAGWAVWRAGAAGAGGVWAEEEKARVKRDRASTARRIPLFFSTSSPFWASREFGKLPTPQKVLRSGISELRGRSGISRGAAAAP